MPLAEELIDRLGQARITKKKKEMRSFLKLANYYQRFVLDFATKAAPLNVVLKKKRPETVQWTFKTQNAFNILREALTEDSVLFSPIMERRFILQRDASGTRIGAVLSQNLTQLSHPILLAIHMNPCIGFHTHSCL